MEANPELEFEHFLALKLSMTVAELGGRMSAAEFARWVVYFGRKAQREEIALAQGKVRR